MMKKQDISFYASCRECGMEYKDMLDKVSMEVHVKRTGHTIIGEEVNRVIIRKG